jgi:hypothetical protein
MEALKGDSLAQLCGAPRGARLMIDKHHVPVSLARKTPPRPTWYPVVCTQNGRTCGGRFTTDAKGLMVS